MWNHMLFLDIMRTMMKIRDMIFHLILWSCLFRDMLLSCYFIVLVLFN